jgi:conjugal transfer mating pair stabilization protein TraG
VGFLLGVLLVLFQGILQGGRGIRFQNVLVAWLLYALMFGPTARVAIEDAYPGAVRVVDNVPLGPAAVGSLMSNVGYGVSRLFEQAFATPAMTDTGFADPLQTLMSVRKGTLSRIALGSANSPTPGADIERSFINYVADCTLYDVDIGGTLTGSYATNEQLQDQIADDIARRVTSDREIPPAWPRG